GLSASGAGGQLASLPLRSPLTGSVIAKDVTVGESVSPADVLFTVADLSSVWVDITVPAQNIAVLRTGQRVRVHVPSTNEEAQGTVSYVGRLVGAENRSAKARVVLPNRGGSWRPGLFVNVHLEAAETMVPVAVRAEALQTFRDWNVVFIQVGNQYEVRPLELGRRDEQWVEVTAGLEAGQKYVAKNSFILKADVLKAGASHDH
ncbi:MAG TPA: efflux RND transporter periplasmic adaptor subunit, partial [Thermoanaerobaculia bacterium]|nr:efflux RND transporter periplasmic adaptor subunit [Thermoanaerobaculia bacterium]